MAKRGPEMTDRERENALLAGIVVTVEGRVRRGENVYDMLDTIQQASPGAHADVVAALDRRGLLT